MWVLCFFLYTNSPTAKVVITTPPTTQPTIMPTVAPWLELSLGSWTFSAKLLESVLPHLSEIWIVITVELLACEVQYKVPLLRSVIPSAVLLSVLENVTGPPCGSTASMWTISCWLMGLVYWRAGLLNIGGSFAETQMIVFRRRKMLVCAWLYMQIQKNSTVYTRKQIKFS